MISQALQQKIGRQIDRNMEEALAFLTRLIKEPSLSGQEKGAQMIVAEKLKQLGCKVDVWEPDIQEMADNPYFVSARKSFEGSPNVVGVLKGSGGGRSLILNGHIDVVPQGEKDWVRSPWSGHVEGSRIYGRGATDMKGGDAAMIMAVQCLKDLGIKLKGDLIIESVIEEESGGAGTLACILRGYHADGAIVPEPTNLRIFPASQGSMWFRVKIKGKAAHGATRYEGISAIEKSVIVLKALENLESIRTSSISNPLYRQGPIPFPINVGKIRGGNWPSAVPEEVVIEGRMGVVPSETVADAKAQFADALAQASEDDAWLKENHPKIEWFGAAWPSGEIPVDHELVHCVKENYCRVEDKIPSIEMSPWATDAGLLMTLGKTPTVVFGPGPTEKAHFANEYCDINTIKTTSQIIALTILDWCGFTAQIPS